MIAARGHCVIRFDSLEDALCQENAVEFDFLLCSLPERDTLYRAVFTRLRAVNPGLRPRLLLLTCGATEAEVNITTTQDGFALLHKPFTGRQLIARIESLLPDETASASFTAPRGARSKRRVRVPEAVHAASP
jgi:DNA-binding response OmpR family regulator